MAIIICVNACACTEGYVCDTYPGVTEQFNVKVEIMLKLLIHCYYYYTMSDSLTPSTSQQKHCAALHCDYAGKCLVLLLSSEHDAEQRNLGVYDRTCD